MANKYWELVEGKMVRKARFPKSEIFEETMVDDLRLQHVVTKSYTFTIEQIKYGCTADKPRDMPVTREQMIKLFASLVRCHRYELFGTFEGYNIITNGYGQLKHVAFSHGNPVKPETIFDKLEQIYLTS